MTEPEQLPLTGDFALDLESRTLRGWLLPFNETSGKSVTGHVAHFAADEIILPRSPEAVTLNRRHSRHDPVGRATVLEKRDKGVYAEFSIFDTEEGDRYLAEERDTLRKLSPEVYYADDRKHARLTGAALVDVGAFASSALFAVATTEEHHEDEFTDENGVTWTRKQDTHREHDDENNVTTTTTTVVESVTPAPDATVAEDNPEGDFAMATSIVPDGVVTPPAETIVPAAEGLFAALANHGRTNDRSGLQPYADVDADRTGLFALADITATGTAATVQSQFVGEIWGRKLYSQRVLPLFAHENLTALKVEGWRWINTPQVGAWAGDKTEVPTGTVSFGQTAVTAERIAGAHDIDRALRDFGNESFWSGYFRAMTESYAKLADEKVFNRIIAAPNSANGIGATVVTPGTVPSGVAAGAAALVDGALSVITAGYTPSFALVSTAIYRDLLLTKKDQTLEFLNQSMGLEEGQLASFRFVPHAGLAAKRVIVGAKEAATVYELPGSPIRVEGLDIAKGGIDPAVYGYIATVVNDVNALASVTTV